MLYFIRHGVTDWNTHKDSNGNKAAKCQGRVDIPLNLEGIEQAKIVREKIKDIEFERVISSPLIRTKQTCEIAYSGNKKIEFDERIIERDFGEFEGLNRKEFDFKGFWDINENQTFIKAENINDVKKRVFPLLDELKQVEGNILLVAHGGVGCIIMSYFLGEPIDGDYRKLEVVHGNVYLLDFNKKEVKTL